MGQGGKNVNREKKCRKGRRERVESRKGEGEALRKDRNLGGGEKRF